MVHLPAHAHPDAYAAGLRSMEDAALLVRRLSFAATVPDIMAVVAETARRLLAADGVTFVLRDGDKCFYAEENAIGPLWKGRRFPLEACISGWVMLNRRPVAIEDIYADPRIPADAYRPTFVKSLAMVPVRTLDPIAAIGAYWADRHAPSPAELEMLLAIADSAALALANLDLQRARLAAEEASAATSKYVAAAGHDLRQPLQSVFLFLNVLSASQLDDRARQALARMELALTGMKDMMDGLLDVARMDAGGRAPKIDSVPLAMVFDPIVATYEPLARSKGLDWHWACPDVSVRTDALLLTRMIRNLVENAIRYTETGRVALIATHRADTVSILVEDTGIGIPPEHLGDVFGEFRQLSAASGRGGYGIGLATVERLSKALDHPVRVSSRLGVGSAFEITLPVA